MKKDPSWYSMLQPESPSQLEVVPRPQYRWYHKTAGLITVILLFELGVFLVVWPWASDWDLAFLPYDLRYIWNSNYFRGAVSGLGGYAAARHLLTPR